MFFNKTYSINNIRKQVVGIDKKVMTKNGKKVNYVNFDNAASTPTIKPVLNKLNNFLQWYSSIHRGTGYKSRISTDVYDKCHEIVGNFVNCDLDKNTVIFVKNTTEAINKLSYRLGLSKNDIIITTLMEHHSNDLPWRNKSKTIHCNILDDGTLDLNFLEHKLKINKGRIKLVTVTGCSNVTGIVNDIHHIATLAHKYNSKLLVDGAQLIPHRKINMKGYNSKDYIDFLVLSGHKMYAPFGSGALIGPKNIFLKGEPEYVGGGTISSVTQYNSYWADLPDKEEAGTPNVVGAVALAESCKILDEIGMDNIKKHEKKLTKHILKELKAINNLKLYSQFNNKKVKDTVGVISFNIQDIPHDLLAAILSYDYGIGVRNGCFCAHPYIHRLLNLSSTEISKLQKNLIFKNLSSTPGLVRVSFGMYNTLDEIDYLLSSLKDIVKNKNQISNEYICNEKNGEYYPKQIPQNMFSDFSI
ncbi:aminotransferase class V-fold PLP-dependent enzyme [Dethiothermospora halolimnae]|uniref:aminotransferase class V-fold PLP-dependent enzyme n=1 Tax=Dethiothermospora halolimnae TaxID=3114390 RepID=UPI003CCB73E1